MPVTDNLLVGKSLLPSCQWELILCFLVDGILLCWSCSFLHINQNLLRTVNDPFSRCHCAETNAKLPTAPVGFSWSPQAGSWPRCRMKKWGSAVFWLDILRGEVLCLREPPCGLSLDLLKVMMIYPSGTLLQSCMVIALSESKCLAWLKVAFPQHYWEPSMTTTGWNSLPLTLTLAAEPWGDCTQGPDSQRFRWLWN